jgi:hypothetical protein
MTNWPEIVERLRENEVLLRCKNPPDAYFQTVLALAEAEKMVKIIEDRTKDERRRDSLRRACAALKEISNDA